MAKKQGSNTNNTVINRRRFRAIQRLCNPYPPQSAGERLDQISDIASGKAPPEIVLQPVSSDLAERLAAGAASRSKRQGDRPASPKREEKRGRDRQEKDAITRTTDLGL